MTEIADEIERRGCRISFSGWHTLPQWTGKHAEMYCWSHEILSRDHQPEDSTPEVLKACEKAMIYSIWLHEDEMKGVDVQ